MYGGHGAVAVGAVRFDAECDLGSVGLARVAQKLQHTSAVVDRDRQYPGRRRIERAGMTDLPLTGPLAYPPDYIVARPPGRFVNHKDSMQ